MRNESEIKQKVTELCDKHLQERKAQYLCQSFLNCKYNERCRIKQHGAVGICHNEDVLKKSRRAIYLCDDDKTAQKCKNYECKNTPESVEADFNEIIREPSKVGREYPKLAVLIWVLQQKPIEQKPIENTPAPTIVVSIGEQEKTHV